MFILLSVYLFIHVLVKHLAVSSGPNDYLQMSTHASSALRYLLCTLSVFSLFLFVLCISCSLFFCSDTNHAKRLVPFLFHIPIFGCADTWVSEEELKKAFSQTCLHKNYWRTRIVIYVFIVLVLVPLVWRHFNCLELAAWAPSPECLAHAKEGRQEQSEPRLTYGSQVIPFPK